MNEIILFVDAQLVYMYDWDDKEKQTRVEDGI
jgi:hypothetical protein